MTERFEKILNQYGESVTITTAEGTGQMKAFVQPVLNEQKEAPYQVTSLGNLDDRKWIYLGVTAVNPGDCITCAAGSFTVCSSAAVYAGREFSHWWAALETEKEAAE